MLLKGYLASISLESGVGACLGLLFCTGRLMFRIFLMLIMFIMES